MPYEYGFGNSVPKRKLKKAFEEGYQHALAEVLESLVKFHSILNFCSTRDKDYLMDNADNYREELGEKKKELVKVEEEMKFKEKKGAITDEDKDKYYAAKKAVEDIQATMEAIDRAKELQKTNFSKFNEQKTHAKYLINNYRNLRSQTLHPELGGEGDAR